MSTDQLSPSGTEVVAQSAEAVAAVVDELRAHQSSWESLGPDVRAIWLRKLRNWLLQNELRRADPEDSDRRDRQAPRRGRIRSHGHLRRDQLLRRPGPKFLAAKELRPHGPLTATKKLTRVYRPYPVVGADHAVELPLTHPRCGRRGGAAGRGGRRRQALGGHSAVRVRTRPRLGTDRCTAGVPMCHRSGRNGRRGGGLGGHGSVHWLHRGPAGPSPRGRAND